MRRDSRLDNLHITISKVPRQLARSLCREIRLCGLGYQGGSLTPVATDSVRKILEVGDGFPRQRARGRR